MTIAARPISIGLRKLRHDARHASEQELHQAQRMHPEIVERAIARRGTRYQEDRR
jgi:hypothetical protein